MKFEDFEVHEDIFQMQSNLEPLVSFQDLLEVSGFLFQEICFTWKQI